MTLIQLNLKNIIDLTDRQFAQIRQTNPNYKFERSQQGELLIVPQTDSQTKQWSWSIANQLWTWNQQTGLGIAFDASSAFRLSNSAIRSPHVAWIESQKWLNISRQISRQQDESIIPGCPDFVLELLSANDTWENLQEKMTEYQDQGVKLGWLIDPILKKIEIYTANQRVVKQALPDCVSGEAILTGFLLDLKVIFQ
jgi:Uma2 family endonuclease